MGNFLRQKWPEIAIIVIGLGGFGWLIQHSMLLGERLARQETRMEGVIAALPDLRTSVAFESVYSRFKSALMVSEPLQTGGANHIDIHVVDAIAGTATKYKVQISKENEEKFYWAILGGMFQIDRGAVSFDDMERMAVKIKVNKFVPSNINKKISKISYENAQKLKETIEALDAKESISFKIPMVSSWSDLVNAIDDGTLSGSKKK